ncbi:MAG TPA: methyltransferase domain-containing protein [Xanthobacteraceae bacterium]|nr:methyltransferase domain-containing protein [Xanthobacteraceae bacterium]
MNAARHVDEKFYQAVPPRSLGERLTVAARDRIYDDFIRYCAPRPDEAILDVGVSDVVNDAANLLERKYPHRARITALGLGDGADFRAAFPDVSYRRIAPHQPLPFADKSFAIAASNAVLEHVGSAANQAAFVAELTRVADRVFITVPHRYFPVEHHTAIPLLHYGDASFALACRMLGKSEWADERNLILMSRRRLRALAPAGAVIAATGLRLGPMSSNLLLFARGGRRGPDGSLDRE